MGRGGQSFGSGPLAGRSQDAPKDRTTPGLLPMGVRTLVTELAAPAHPVPGGFLGGIRVLLSLGSRTKSQGVGRCPRWSFSHLAHLSHFSVTSLAGASLPGRLHWSFREVTRARMVWGGWVWRLVRLRLPPAARAGRGACGGPGASIAPGDTCGSQDWAGIKPHPPVLGPPVCGDSLVDALSPSSHFQVLIRELFSSF